MVSNVREKGSELQHRTNAGRIARVAQLVEHTLGKGEVIGSIPIASSRVVERTDMSVGTTGAFDRLSYKLIAVGAASGGRTIGATKQGGRWGTNASGGYWLSNPFSFRE